MVGTKRSPPPAGGGGGGKKKSTRVNTTRPPTVQNTVDALNAAVDNDEASLGDSYHNKPDNNDAASVSLPTRSRTWLLVAVLAVVLGAVAGGIAVALMKANHHHHDNTSSSAGGHGQLTPQAYSSDGSNVDGDIQGAIIPPSLASPSIASTSSSFSLPVEPVAPAKGVASISPSSSHSNNDNNLLKQLFHNGVDSIGQLIKTARQSTCTPLDGAEIKHMVEDRPGCAIIMLEAGKEYNITQEIFVTRRVTVLGQPIHKPFLRASGAPRIFHVLAGGVLDVRFVGFNTGKAIQASPGVKLLRGGSILIDKGGRAVITGSTFEITVPKNPDFILSSDLSQTARMEGGNILLTGGILHLQPGVIFREKYVFGGNVLALSGEVFFNGCIFYGAIFFNQVYGAGFVVSIMGGTAIFTGCIFMYVSGFTAVGGVGIVAFIGAGVVVFTGCIIKNNGVMGSFAGAGVLVYVSTGVSVVVGSIVDKEGVASMVAGAGFLELVGAGVRIAIGCLFHSSTVMSFVAAVGGGTFLGSGTLVDVGHVYDRQVVLSSFYGCGGSYFVGAGVITLSHLFESSQSVITASGSTGAYLFMGAGWLTMTHVYWLTRPVIHMVASRGGFIHILGGGAYFDDVTINTRRILTYVTPSTSLIQVGANKVSRAYITSLVVTSGRSPYMKLKHMSLINTQLSTRHLELPTSLPANTTQQMEESGGDEGLGGNATRLAVVEVQDPVDVCALCDLPKGVVVSGGGASSCTNSPTCDQDDSKEALDPPPYRRMWQPASEAKEDLPDTFLYLVGLTVTFATTNTSIGLQASDLRGPIESLASSSWGGLPLREMGVVMVVVDDDNTLVPVPPSPLLGDCANEMDINAYFVSDNITSIKAVQDLFEATGADVLLSSALQQQTMSGRVASNVTLCGVQVTSTRSLHVPGNGVMNTTNTTMGDMDLVIPRLLLVDGTTGQLVRAIHRGGTYQLDLEGFDEDARVILRLVNEVGSEVPIGAISSFTPPKHSYDWTVRALLPPPGELVYIKAYQEDDPTIIGYAPEVTIESTSTSSSSEGIPPSSSSIPLQRLKDLIGQRGGNRRMYYRKTRYNRSRKEKVVR